MEKLFELVESKQRLKHNLPVRELVSRQFFPSVKVFFRGFMRRVLSISVFWPAIDYACLDAAGLGTV